MPNLIGKQVRINIGTLLMIFLLVATPLVCTHTATARNVTTLLLVLCNANLLGAWLLSRSAINTALLSLSHTALSALIGSIVFSLLLFASANPNVQMIIHCSFLFVFLLGMRRSIEWGVKPGMPGFILFAGALCVLALVSQSDIHKQFSPVQVGTQFYATDSYFFTAIVATIRKGTIFNAAFEVGSPLNYQTFAFFVPAFWANVLKISSHQALWGMALPFYKLVIVLFGYELFFFFLRDHVKRDNIMFIICAVAFPILLAPLHPAYLLRGDVQNFIFNGMGYLTPTGTIAYPITIAFFLVSLLLFYTIDWKNGKMSFDKFFFAVTLSVMMVGKLQLHFAYLIFLGVVVLRRVLFRQERLLNYLPYGVLSLVLSIIYFKILMGQPSGEHMSVKYGYLAEAFAKWFGGNVSTVAGNVKTLAVIAGVYLLWMGIRLVGLFADVRSRISNMNDLFWGSIFSLIGTTCFALLVRMKMQMGTIVVDMTFNVEQFVRSSFFIITIAASIGILYVLFSADTKKVYRSLMAAATGIWCLLALMTTFHYTYIRKEDAEETPWYTDNYSILRSGRLNDGLIVVNPRSGMGIMLAASDYGTYWSAMDRGEGSYNCSLKNTYRWSLFKNLITVPEEKYLLQMKQEGVKYIIATPYDTAQLATISQAFPRHVSKLDSTKWVYELK